MTKGFNPQTPELRVNTYTTGDQLYSTVHTLANGNYFVLWTSNGQDGSGQGIYSQMYSGNGTEIGTETRINTYTLNDQTDPSFTELGNGDYIITWVSDGQDGSDEGIYAQRYDSGGNALGSEFLVNTYTNLRQQNPTITTLSNDRFVIMWETKAFADEIKGQIFDANGNMVGSEFQVNTAVAWIQESTDIIGLDDGGFVAVWATPIARKIVGQRFDANGSKVGNEYLLNTDTSGDVDDPIITPLTGGGFVVTWAGRKPSSTISNGNFAQVYDGNNVPVGSEIYLPVGNNPISAATPSITALENGGFFITWTETRDDAPDLSSIYGQFFAADGNAVGDSFRVNTYTTDYQFKPQVVTLADGGIVVVWTSDGSGATGQDGSESGVYAQRYDSSGNPVGSEHRVNNYTTDYQKLQSIAALDNGGFVITWISRYQDGSGNGIYSQQFKPQLFGTSANDVIVDTVGANWIDGQGGNDVLVGGLGNDVLNGGHGFDTVDYSGAGGAVQVYLNLEKSRGADGYDQLLNIEKIIGSSYDDYLFGNAGRNIIIGGDGNDVIKTKGGNDTVHAGRGDDKIIGAEGDETLNGGSGNDVIQGLSGNDSLNGHTGSDFLYGGRGNDVLNGGTGNDRLYGNRGNDTLNGNEHSDRLYGGGGNDMLNGQAGNDYLYGDNGNDILNGGAGNDSMTGGTGADTFVFEASVAENIDKVKDFTNGDDKLDLGSFGFASFADVQALATDAGWALKLDFGGSNLLYLEGFALADFDASDVIL